MGEGPTPDDPHAGKRRPSPGALVPPPQRAKPACKSTRCGVGDGSPRPQPPQPPPVGSGPRPHAPRTGGRAGESAQPRTPHTQARDAPPPEHACAAPQGANPARKSARRGVGDAFPRPEPPQPPPVGSGPRPHAPRTGGQARESAQPWQEAPPPPGILVPPPQRAKPARKNARCGVGDESPRRHTRTYSEWVVGPGRMPQGRAVGRG